MGVDTRYTRCVCVRCACVRRKRVHSFTDPTSGRPNFRWLLLKQTSHRQR